MAKLILDLVEGGSISLEGKKGFIEIAYKKKEGGEEELGLLRRDDFLPLQNFLAGHIASLPTLSDEIQVQMMEIMKPYMEEMRRLARGDNEPPPSEED